MVELFAVKTDQMLHSAAPDLGLHCVLITRLMVSRLQWVKASNKNFSRLHSKI